MTVATPPLTVALIVIVLAFVGAILSEKSKVSYTTIMIIIGLALSFLRIAGGLTSLPLDSNIILGFVVPPIIFEAAMRTRYEIFKTVRKTVLALAILGVILSALFCGLVLNLAIGLPLAVALTFGVIVAPTDPISVINVLKKMKAPEKLATILEAEAYLNDATAVILFPIAVSLTFNPIQSAGVFTYTFGGGVLVGLAVSGIAEIMHRLVTEPLAETSFTIAVIFGSYALATTLGVAGLVAVAIAGIYMGNRTMQIAMSTETRQTMAKFWEVVTFLAASFAFLLLGLKVDVTLLVTFAPFIIAAFLTILLSRVVSVYPIIGITGLLGEKIPHDWTRLLAMAGLRGVISVALALSLPDSFPFREAVVTMTFGVALLSLIVQGELLQLYLRKRGQGSRTSVARHSQGRWGRVRAVFAH